MAQTETTDRPETITIDQEAELVAAAVAEFPSEFGLRGYPGQAFRVSPTASYYSRGWDRGEFDRSPAGVQVYTQVNRDGEWMDFAKGTVAELRRELTDSPRIEKKVADAITPRVVEAAKRYLEIEDESEKISRAFEEIDEAQHDLDERRRKVGERFDTLFTTAADELDDDDFHEIFGTYPDRSNRPDAKP